MAKQLQLRKGTTAEHSGFTGAVAEVTVDTTKNVVVVHDKNTAGGFPMAKAIDTAYAIATVDDFTSVPAGITTVIVKDKNRGGVFNRITSTTANGGTIFSGIGYSWERQYSGAVNVKWFGAVGDDSNDDTVSIQNTINYAKLYANKVFIPKGIYKITSSLNITNDHTLKIQGSGRGSFSTDLASSLLLDGTVLKLYTQNTNLLTFSNGYGRTVTNIEDIAFLNVSGGTNESALFSLNPVFTYINNITIGGFNYGINFEKSLYITVKNALIRRCTYGISMWQNTGTPPYTLNTTYFNNVISIEDSQITYTTVGVQVAGANIVIKNVDTSIFSSYGIIIGSTNMGGSVASIISHYSEGNTGTPIYIVGASVSLSTIMFAGGMTNGIYALDSNVTIDSWRSYGAITTGIQSDNSKVVINGQYRGNIANPFANSNGGTTRLVYKELATSSSFNLSYGTTTTISIGSTSSRWYKLSVLGSDNGTNFGLEVIIKGNQVYIVGTNPTYLSVSSVVNGNGTYDVQFGNTASSAYSLSANIAIEPLYYSIPL